VPALAGGAALAAHAPQVIAAPRIRWRMPTAFPATLDVIHGSAHRLADLVSNMSGGQFRIEVFAAGEIVPALGVFEACAKGTVEAFMGASYYWDKQEPANSWFCTVPFGMNPQGMMAWYFQGGGMKLWEETYAAFGLVPRPGVPMAPQMAGWFRRKINTVADFKGLRMRIPGLGGQVVSRVGGTAVLTPAGEIFSALERGVIDASEWIGPHDDIKLGLQRTARYYYYPGWHEPGTTLEFTFNRKAYDALPVEMKQILDQATAATWALAVPEWEAKNAIALGMLRTQHRADVEILPLPVQVLRELRKIATDVVRQESEKSPMARKVYASFTRFQAQVGDWGQISEGAYHRLIVG
jgi:TRAP-type mannitol/chloroaromatic compound transport system substrate-binding protein